MYIKNKIQLVFIFLSSFLIIISTFIKNFEIGKIWYYLNPTSLVGFQGLIEKNQEIFFLFNLDFLISFLNYHLLLVVGIFLFLISFFLNLLWD